MAGGEGLGLPLLKTPWPLGARRLELLKEISGMLDFPSRVPLLCIQSVPEPRSPY